MKTIRVTEEEARARFRPISASSHKGTQGHAMIIGGSYGKIGSVCLGSEAALRSGCGLATCLLPKIGYQIIQTSVPEAMAITSGDKFITSMVFEIAPNAIGIGPGMGKEPQTINAFHQFLKNQKTPLVIDADAINILSENIEWLSLLPPQSVITPHAVELRRLIGDYSSEQEKFKMIEALSAENDLIFVLKGAPTKIFYHNTLYQNSTGNAALATAGSGDVLTGIITGLIAQGYLPLDASLLGVFLHGLAADLALPETGTHGFIASDILKYLGKAWLQVAVSDS